MPHTLDAILPSLESLGVWAYWIIGLAALFEAWFVTGVFVPGTLVVDAGGILVQQGAIDFFDLAWFVAIGSVIGAEAGFWTGRLVKRGLAGRSRFERSTAYARAERLFDSHGGMALVMGRFLGPVSGLVPLAAALAGMDRRRFILWNLAAGLPYALIHVAIGYFLGDVFTRLSPAVTRLALLVAALLVGLVLIWWIVLRVERFLPFVLSLGRSVARAVVENPDVAAWAGQHPGLARGIARRLDTSHFGGLAATFLGFVFVYLAGVWAGSSFDFLTSDPILQVDDRVASLVHTFWTPTALTVATWVTALGDWKVVLPLGAGAVIWLLVKGRDGLALGLAVSLVGNLVSVMALKTVFHRPRPELAYFAETTNSFPSGHAAISVAFWAMLFYALWRARRLGLVAASLAATAVAFAIGVSRIYLIEHFMTDVANGWLVGSLWLVIGISLAEWRAERAPVRPRLTAAPKLRLVVLALAAALAPVAGWNVASYQKARNIPPAAVAVTRIADLAAMLADPDWVATTESVLGAPLQPVNVVFLAPDADALAQTLDAAGWTLVRPPVPAALLRAAWAAWTNQPDDGAPVTPYFWDGDPNDFGFQKSTPASTLRERHHVRVWHTDFVLADGNRVFVGAASFDDGLDPGIFHHIDPNIDAERDTLAKDLVGAGARRLVPLAVSQPRLGQSVAGDPWFTDGNAAVIAID